MCMMLEEKFQMCSCITHYKKKQIRDKINYVDLRLQNICVGRQPKVIAYW
jgi:hypothetical protein